MKVFSNCDLDVGDGGSMALCCNHSDGSNMADQTH